MEIFSTRVPPMYLVGWEHTISLVSDNKYTDFVFAAPNKDLAVQALNQFVGSRAQNQGGANAFKTENELKTTSNDASLAFFCERLQADIGSIQIESVAAKLQDGELMRVRIVLREQDKVRVLYVSDENMLAGGLAFLWKEEDLIHDINSLF